MNDLITTDEAAARLGVHKRSILNYIAAGRIASRKIGHYHFIDPAHLESFEKPPMGRPTTPKETEPKKRRRK